MKNEVIDKFSALMTASFGLVAALAWSDTIKAVIKEYFGRPDAVKPMIIYAVTVTLFAIIATKVIADVPAKAKGIDF